MVVLLPSTVPPQVASFAVRQLAHADYTIATKISEDVAVFVPWALQHNLGWAADASMAVLQWCDSLGGVWIHIACFLVRHAHP